MVRKNKEDEDDWRPPAKTTSRKRPKTWAANQTTSLRKALLTNKKKKAEARPVVEDDDNINAQYYEYFRQHVVDLRAHLAGKWTGGDDAPQEPDIPDRQVDMGVDIDSDEDADGGEPFDPFTTTKWTDVEKDAFFHAVATHSRLRPDLIAASIKTKNMYDVCLYMRFLDDHLAKLKEDELNFAPDSTTEPETNDGSSENGTSDGAAKYNENLPADDDDSNKPRAFESDASKKARRDARLDAAALQRRNAAPRAMEMTVPWIEFEEALAKLLCSLEDDDQRRGGDVVFTSAAAGQEQGASDGRGSLSKKQKLTKKNKGKARAREGEEGFESEGSCSIHSSSPPRPSQEQAPSSKDTPTLGPSAWKTSNVYFLDGHLQVLETILRDAEDARAAADFAGQSSFIQGKKRRRSRDKSRASSSSLANAKASFVHDDETAMVDSSTFRVVGLRSSPSAEGQPGSNAKSKGKAKSNGNSTGDENMDEYDVDSYILPRRGEREGSVASTSASSSRPHPKSQLKSQWKSDARGKADQGHGGYDGGEEEECERKAPENQDESKQNRDEEENEEGRALKDPDLCPTVRRRFLNRIYMRKRRAMMSGGLEAVEAVDTKSVRLKPGRRKRNADSFSKAKPHATPGEQESTVEVGKKRKREGSDGEEGSGDDEGGEGENVDEDRVDKRDKRDKFWSDIEEAGINEETLAKEGMAYFNLSMLGKLLNYFSSGYRDRTIPGQPVISASLIRVMFTTVVEFLVDIIHRSVILAECSSSVRTGSKVFRQNNDYITVESIKLALETSGYPLEDRRTFFSRLLGDKRSPAPLHGTIIQPTTPTAELAGMAFHRSLYLPFIQLPREYGGRGVGEEEDDAIEGREGRRGYLEAVEKGNESESDVGEVIGDGYHGAIVGEDEEVERRQRLEKWEGIEKAAEYDVEMVEEEEEEDPDLLALCEDPVLPRGTDDAEDQEFEREMAEEEALDAKDMSAAKNFEADAWDRTLKAGDTAGVIFS